MLNAKAMGWSLTAGFVTLVILMGSSMLLGDTGDSTAEEIAYLATNND